MPNNDQFNRLEDRFDSLSQKIEENHKELTEAIHKVDLNVSRHDNFLKWIAPTGGALGLFSFITGLFKQ